MDYRQALSPFDPDEDIPLPPYYVQHDADSYKDTRTGTMYRNLGYDAPEMFNPYAQTPREVMAREATQAAAQYHLDHGVDPNVVGMDRSGRRPIDADPELADYMVRNLYASPMTGFDHETPEFRSRMQDAQREATRRMLYDPTDPVVSKLRAIPPRNYITDPAPALSHTPRGLPVFTNAVERGVDNLQSSLYGGAHALARTAQELTGIDTDGVQKWADEGVKRNETEAAMNPAKYRDWGDVHGLGDFGGYVAERVGENLPQVLPMAVGAMAGAAAAPAVTAGTILARAGMAMRSAQAYAGATAANTISQAGEVENEQMEQPKDKRASGAEVLGTAALRAGLDVLSAKVGLDNVFDAKRITGAKDIAGRLLGAIGVGSVTEGTTEVAQEALAMGLRAAHDKNYDPFDKDGIARLKETAIAAGVVGGAMSGAGHLGGTAMAHMTPTEEELQQRRAAPQSGTTPATTPAATPEAGATPVIEPVFDQFGNQIDTTAVPPAGGVPPSVTGSGLEPARERDLNSITSDNSVTGENNGTNQSLPAGQASSNGTGDDIRSQSDVGLISSQSNDLPSLTSNQENQDGLQEKDAAETQEINREVGAAFTPTHIDNHGETYQLLPSGDYLSDTGRVWSESAMMLAPGLKPIEAKPSPSFVGGLGGGVGEKIKEYEAFPPGTKIESYGRPIPYRDGKLHVYDEKLPDGRWQLFIGGYPEGDPVETQYLPEFTPVISYPENIPAQEVSTNKGFVSSKNLPNGSDRAADSDQLLVNRYKDVDIGTLPHDEWLNVARAQIRLDRKYLTPERPLEEQIANKEALIKVLEGSPDGSQYLESEKASLAELIARRDSRPNATPSPPNTSEPRAKSEVLSSEVEDPRVRQKKVRNDWVANRVLTLGEEVRRETDPVRKAELETQLAQFQKEHDRALAEATKADAVANRTMMGNEANWVSDEDRATSHAQTLAKNEQERVGPAPLTDDELHQFEDNEALTRVISEDEEAQASDEALSLEGRSPDRPAVVYYGTNQSSSAKLEHTTGAITPEDKDSLLASGLALSGKDRFVNRGDGTLIAVGKGQSVTEAEGEDVVYRAVKTGNAWRIQKEERQVNKPIESLSPIQISERLQDAASPDRIEHISKDSKLTLTKGDSTLEVDATRLTRLGQSLSGVTGDVTPAQARDYFAAGLAAAIEDSGLSIDQVPDNTIIHYTGKAKTDGKTPIRKLEARRKKKQDVMRRLTGLPRLTAKQAKLLQDVKAEIAQLDREIADDALTGNTIRWGQVKHLPRPEEYYSKDKTGIATSDELGQQWIENEDRIEGLTSGLDQEESRPGIERAGENVLADDQLDSKEMRTATDNSFVNPTAFEPTETPELTSTVTLEQAEQARAIVSAKHPDVKVFPITGVILPKVQRVLTQLIKFAGLDLGGPVVLARTVKGSIGGVVQLPDGSFAVLLDSRLLVSTSKRTALSSAAYVGGHEVGHLVDKSLGLPSDMAEWQVGGILHKEMADWALGSGRYNYSVDRALMRLENMLLGKSRYDLSKYGSELFADAFSLTVNFPEVIEREAPNTYKYIRHIIETGGISPDWQAQKTNTGRAVNDSGATEGVGTGKHRNGLESARGERSFGTRALHSTAGITEAFEQIAQDLNLQTDFRIVDADGKITLLEELSAKLSELKAAKNPDNARIEALQNTIDELSSADSARIIYNDASPYGADRVPVIYVPEQGAEAIDKTAHEFGHLIMRAALTKLINDMKAGVEDAKVVVDSIFGGVDWHNPDQVSLAGERFAEMTRKWTHTNAKPRGVIDQFFHDLASQLRLFYDQVVRLFRKDKVAKPSKKSNAGTSAQFASFEKFMDAMMNPWSSYTFKTEFGKTALLSMSDMSRSPFLERNVGNQVDHYTTDDLENHIKQGYDVVKNWQPKYGALKSIPWALKTASSIYKAMSPHMQGNVEWLHDIGLEALGSHWWVRPGDQMPKFFYHISMDETGGIVKTRKPFTVIPEEIRAIMGDGHGGQSIQDHMSEVLNALPKLSGAEFLSPSKRAAAYEQRTAIGKELIDLTTGAKKRADLSKAALDIADYFGWTFERFQNNPEYSVFSKHRKDYSPLVIDRDAWLSKAHDVAAVLVRRMGVGHEEAMDIVHRIASSHGVLDTDLLDRTVLPSSFSAKHARVFDPATQRELAALGVYSTDIHHIVTSYTKQVVKRAVEQTRFGDYKRNADGSLVIEEVWDENKQRFIQRYVFDPMGQINQLLETAGKAGTFKIPGGLTTQQVDHIRKRTLPSLRGTLGADMDPNIRAFLDYSGAALQTIMLPLAVTSQLPDLAGIAINMERNPLNPFTAAKDFGKSARTLLNKEERGRWLDLAYRIGTITPRLVDHVLSEGMVDDQMTPSVKRYNEWFFETIGMKAFTDASRILALAFGHEQLSYYASELSKGNTSIEEKLKDLGVTSDELRAWYDDGAGIDVADLEKHPRMKVALAQWTNYAVLRPEAAHLPYFGSDPRFKLFMMLKRFLYGYHYTMMKRIYVQMGRQQNLMAAVPLLSAAVFSMGLAAAGYALRKELAEDVIPGVLGVDHSGDYKTPEGFDYLSEMVDRSGMLGPFAILHDMYNAEKRGQMALTSFMGPAFSKLMDFYDKDLPTFVANSIPVVAQSSVLRHSARDVLDDYLPDEFIGPDRKSKSG